MTDTGRRPRDPDDDGLEALLASGSFVPEDASALDELPPYSSGPYEASPDALRGPTRRRGPGRFDQLYDQDAPRREEPVRDVPDTGLGRPLDLSQDPDRFRAEPPPATGVPDTGLGRPLDLSQDPDRFDAAADAGPAGPLDPAFDPDRFQGYGRVPPAGAGMTLQDLLGEGAQEGERDGMEWLVGLLAVLAFLGLVAFVFSRVGAG